MSIAKCCELLGLQESEISVSKLLKAYRQKEADLLEAIDAADWAFGEQDSIEIALAKQADRQTHQARLDQIWAAALHLETALHLDRPGELSGPWGLSLLEPNPSSWRQAMLLHLSWQAKRQRVAWSGDSVYAISSSDALWKPLQANCQGKVEKWIWRQCDQQLHYRFWAELVEHGTSSIQKLLMVQPEFPQLWLRADAWSWQGQVFLANEQRWVDGLAEQAIPDYHLPLDGNENFWATALGWPARAKAQKRCATGDPALEALQDPTLPLTSCTSWLADPVPLIDRFLQAVQITFQLCKKQQGPLDRFFQ